MSKLPCIFLQFEAGISRTPHDAAYTENVIPLHVAVSLPILIGNVPLYSTVSAANQQQQQEVITQQPSGRSS